MGTYQFSVLCAGHEMIVKFEAISYQQAQLMFYDFLKSAPLMEAMNPNDLITI